MIPDMSKLYRIVILTEYDGTDFVGFQRQNNGRSVQQVLEKALADIYGMPTLVYGCSRTDSGVHARGHVSHVNVPFLIPSDKLPLAMNSLLPDDVCVRASSRVSDDFHARFHTEGKEYVYRIWNSPIRPAIDRRNVAHVPGHLDLTAMRKAASELEGEHDFSAFCAQGGTHVNPVRYMESICIVEHADSPLIEIVVRGKSFLYNMVRILAGTIVYAGQGRLDPSAISSILADKDRRLSGKTMPARGLTLEKVFYQNNPFDRIADQVTSEK